MVEDEPKTDALEVRSADYVASAAKAALGAVPFVGSLLAEIAGAVIPNQRIDRIGKFAEALEERLRSVEQNVVKSQLTNENFTELMEEALRQAARSVSQERREYIASLVARSLTAEQVEYQEAKHLLRILGELNDVEILWLRLHLVSTLGGDEEFRKKHEDVFRPVQAVIGAGRSILDKAALQESYKEHLAQLGLLERQYQIDSRTKQPEYDSFTGALKLRGYRLTPLGRLLLRYICLATDEGRAA